MPEWDALYRRHAAAVWRSAWRILRDREGAADCVQETFLSALGHPQAETVREWEAFLVSVAVRRALDQLRARCRRERRESAAASACSPGSCPEQAAAVSELADRLRRALADLPAQQAEVFCLRTFDEMSYDDIALQLGFSSPHVGVLLHRARQALGRALHDLRPDDASRVDNAPRPVLAPREE